MVLTHTHTPARPYCGGTQKFSTEIESGTTFFLCYYHQNGSSTNHQRLQKTSTHTSVHTKFESNHPLDGFGDLVVSMLASGTQVCGFKRGRSRWIFTGVKILSMPSSGGVVKESVLCPSFVACKRT